MIDRRELIRNFRESAPIRGLKWMLRMPMRVWCLGLDRVTRNRRDHALAVGAIFKDEGRFLDDWIRFHAGQGATHFYLYNNNSSDGYRDVLQPWIDRGFVTLIDLPGERKQKAAYRDCLRRTRIRARWVAFLDIDEYVFTSDGRSIPEVLGDFADYPAVFMYWRMFGASGHDLRPDLPVPLAYTERAADYGHVSGKSIVNPCLVRTSNNAHVFPLWAGKTCDTDGRIVTDVPVETPMVVTEEREVLRINHYWSRSMEDMRDKVRRGDVWYGEASGPYDEEKWRRYQAFEARLQGVEDRSILPAHRKAATFGES